LHKVALKMAAGSGRTVVKAMLIAWQTLNKIAQPNDARFDLITSLDAGETSIVDFKSTERAQAEEITRDQLHIYAVGFQELTGQHANVLEVLNLDKKGKTTRELVNDSLLTEIRDKIADAGENLCAKPAAPPSSLVLDVRGLRPPRPLQESPATIIDHFIESCYGGRSFDSSGRGRGRT
jgi:hypothetical protein